MYRLNGGSAFRQETEIGECVRCVDVHFEIIYNVGNRIRRCITPGLRSVRSKQNENIICSVVVCA